MRIEVEDCGCGRGSGVDEGEFDSDELAVDDRLEADLVCGLRADDGIGARIGDQAIAIDDDDIAWICRAWISP